MRMRPAEPYTGICFVRTDQSPPIRIAARVENVSKRARRTALHNGSIAIETVEHCLSACAGLGIDNIEYFRPSGEPDADYDTYKHHL